MTTDNNSYTGESNAEMDVMAHKVARIADAFIDLAQQQEAERVATQSAMQDYYFSAQENNDAGQTTEGKEDREGRTESGEGDGRQDEKASSETERVTRNEELRSKVRRLSNRGQA